MFSNYHHCLHSFTSDWSISKPGTFDLFCAASYEASMIFPHPPKTYESIAMSIVKIQSKYVPNHIGNILDMNTSNAFLHA